MGMVNQLSKFSPHTAEVSKLLRELLSMKKSWLWGPAQDGTFDKVKQELTKPTVLALYDSQANTKISADASAHGLDQCFSSNTLTCTGSQLRNTERRYSQIQKKALAIAWACEKFVNYILGKAIHLETNHKPWSHS